MYVLHSTVRDVNVLSLFSGCEKYLFTTQCVLLSLGPRDSPCPFVLYKFQALCFKACLGLFFNASMYRVPLLDISRLRTGTKTNFVSFANETTYEVQL